MADVVNTAADTFSGQNHCGGLAVSPCGRSAAGTPEGSHSEPEVVLVDADAGRGAGQRPGPHERDARAVRQAPPTVCDGEATERVVKDGHGFLVRP
jgi:hypothetical protein